MILSRIQNLLLMMRVFHVNNVRNQSNNNHNRVLITQANKVAYTLRVNNNLMNKMITITQNLVKIHKFRVKREKKKWKTQLTNFRNDN